MSVAELIVMMKLKADQFNSGLQGLKEKLASLDSSIRKAVPGSQMLATGLLAIAAAAGGLIIKGISLAAELEQTEVAFTTLLGSGEAATKMMKDLQDFAATTPFQFPELANGAKMLAAFGVETEDIIPTMQRLGDVSAGIGAPIGEIAEIYGKAKVQGRLFMEDINQLTGRGIPIIQELAKQFGVTEEEVRSLVSSGQVNFGHLEEAFISLTSEGGKFEGLMAAQSQTLGGLWSTLKDNIGISLASIGKTIVEAFDLKDKMAGWIEGLGKITTSIQEFADLVSEVGLKEALSQLFSEETKVKIAIIAGAILGALVPAAYAAAAAFLAMMLPLLPFILIGAAIGALAYVIYANWDKLKIFFTNFWESIKLKWEETVAWFTGLWTGIKDSATSKWEEMKTQTAAVWESYKATMQSTWNGIASYFQSVWQNIRNIGGGSVGQVVDTIVAGFQRAYDFIKSIWNAALSFFRSIWEAIKALFRGDLNAVRSHLEDAFNNMANFIRSIGGRMVQYGRDIVQGLIDGVKDMARRLVDAVKGVVNSAIDAAKNLLGISSPSKLFFEIGGNVGTGFVEGIDSIKSLVAKSMQGMVTPAFGQASFAGAGSANAGQYLPQQSSSQTITLDMRGLFDGANINMSSEGDAETLARKIYQIASSKARSEGTIL